MLYAIGDGEWSPESPVMKTLHAGQRAVFDSVLLTKTGNRIPVEVSAYLFEFRSKPAVLAISHDISNHMSRQTVKKRTQIES